MTRNNALQKKKGETAMKTSAKILSILLALITVISVFASCGVQTDTTHADDVTEPADVDTSVTEPTETESTVDVPEPNHNLVMLDFETDLALADYISSTEGIALHEASGGEISDGKWIYSGKPLVVKDDMDIYSLDYYSIEFDFCFDSFVNKDSTSVFSFISDDDGVLNGESGFYIPFKMNMDGLIYHNRVKDITFQVETGKTHHYKLDVNNVKRTATVYIDGRLLVSASYTRDIREYQCFRIMDGGRGADMWLDNFAIIDTAASESSGTESLAPAVEGAYTRGGKYGNEPQGLAEDSYIELKYSPSDKTYDRHGFLKFDISKLQRDKVRYAVLYCNFLQLNAESLYDIYWVDSDWDTETLTYNNMPEGEKIFENVKFSQAGLELDFSEIIRVALADGDQYFSIKISPVNQPTGAQIRLCFSTDLKPVITVYDKRPEKGYFTDLTGDAVKNEEIWDYAQQMYDEWYAVYKSLPELNEDAVLLGRDESQYNKTNYMSGQSTSYASSKMPYKSRRFEDLTDFDKNVSEEFKNAKLDKYGGIMVESLKQKATGFFYTAKIDGRWWMIDPLGYPYISIGLSDIIYAQTGSKLQNDNALKLYGDFDSWALATTRQVVDELYFNNSFRPAENIIALEDGMPFGVQVSLMSNYGRVKGILGDGNGSTVFTENNTMPVFDPDFVTYTDGWAKSSLKYQNNDRLIGYMSDNELPMDSDMLDRALSVNYTKDANWYTYACAWTWLCNITGKDAPTNEDITPELRDLYRGFVWNKYFSVASAAIKKYDPDHMYIGVRFVTEARDSKWVLRFAALYLDCMTINWYGDWEPDANALYEISRNGDIPFIVSEFYTKAGDSGLGNTSGVGGYVATQTDRADYYETFTIRMLQSSNCVGWQWLQYMDNDPNSGTGDASSVDSNKGIYRSDFTLYTELTDRMAILNRNVYNIIDYFANK